MKKPRRKADALTLQWRRRIAEAKAESLRRFGPTPDPYAVLTAIVDSSPGAHFVEHIDQLVIEFAAARILGRKLEP